MIKNPHQKGCGLDGKYHADNGQHHVYKRKLLSKHTPGPFMRRAGPLADGQAAAARLKTKQSPRAYIIVPKAARR